MPDELDDPEPEPVDVAAGAEPEDDFDVDDPPPQPARTIATIASASAAGRRGEHSSAVISSPFGFGGSTRFYPPTTDALNRGLLPTARV
jgi:hypothetical protein